VGPGRRKGFGGLASGSELIGRDSELSRLRGLVDPPPAGSRVLVLLGEAGMGKTVLLAGAERHARSAGLRVLSAAGRESEQDLAFAGLHQLLRPVLDRVADLPDRQAKALLGALALSPDPVAPDPLLTGLAVLTLLSLLAQDGPVLVLIDDGQWVDPASVDALAFAARRLESERLVLLVAARGEAPPAGFERGYPELRLEPLGTLDAARLLDALPDPPHGRAREQVLGQAAGNPMALIELARVIAADPAAGRRWASEPLPPTQRLAAIITARYRALPQATRQALLLGAVADGPDLPAGVPWLTAGALVPAENAGLVRVDSAGFQFSHPLVRAAVYHAAPFAERAAAHLTMAGTLGGQPDRYAWHLAAATLKPDEQVALLLEETADQAQRRGGAAAAARALERAAELSPGKPQQARRLLAAGQLARDTGQSDWVQELAARVLTLTTDPELRITARWLSGWALIWSNRHTDALPALLSVAEQAPSRLPIAWSAIALAATVAYHAGTPAARQAVLATFSRMHEQPQPSEDWPAEQADVLRLWIKASSNPFGNRGELIASLRRIASGTVSQPADVGANAWLLDETDLAIRLLREDLSGVRGRGRYGPVLSALLWAYIDGGRWDEALSTARETADTAAAYKMGTIAASADLATATVLAMRGDHDRVPPLIASALARVDATADRATAARARHAAGIAALAGGSYATAYARLRTLFDADGTPLHNHVSYLAIADLAAAAARAERSLEAHTLIERALAQVDPAPGPRLDQLAARARALLAGNSSAEAHFGKALADPAGDTWPFERAQLQLDYGEWLRRQRRINDAKPVLAAALETLRSLGAAPWIRRAEAELRACGVTAQAAATAPGALADLTPQQREIVTLASQGLTNGEIADRLFLSPHTVATHLYNSYPKLGIAGRHQLRDLIDQAPDRPADRR
jgi:DNA-binding CsgD family transcriptional regulator